jgi:hypothetical protein
MSMTHNVIVAVDAIYLNYCTCFVLFRQYFVGLIEKTVTLILIVIFVISENSSGSLWMCLSLYLLLMPAAAAALHLPLCFVHAHIYTGYRPTLT